MPKRQGVIEVICGSMFSGKTEELLRRLRRARIARQPTQLFKPHLDERYGRQKVATHFGLARTDVTVVDDALALLSRVAAQTQVISIDEGQFFGAKLVDVCAYYKHHGKRLIVSGLDQDYRGAPFDPMPQLMALADRVDKLRAICQRCGAAASRTQRLINGAPAHLHDPLILVGGLESYEARCNSCHKVGGLQVRKPS